MLNRIILFLKRKINYEFWPYWVFYSPFVFVWLYYSFKLRSFSYFCLANPGIEYGGFFQYSKGSVLKKIAKTYLPKSYYFSNAVEVPSDLNIYFPIICKPDIGERGKGVVMIKNPKEWKEFKMTLQEPFIIQEYIEFPLELGVLYYKKPSGESGITSIVSKNFLTLVGDGSSSIEELMSLELRAQSRLEFLKQKFALRLGEVLPQGEKLILEEIGNHSRGTEFVSANHLINQKLVTVFDQIAKSIDGFQYGRFDLRVKSVADLYKGQNIRIMELNGVNSEAAHIYDPSMNLWDAYVDVFANLSLVYEIAKEQKIKGLKPPKTVEMFGGLLKHFKSA